MAGFAGCSQVAAQKFERVERNAGAPGHAGSRVFGQIGGDAGLFGDQDVKAVQHRAATGHHNPPVDDVRSQFRWRPFQHAFHAVDDQADRFRHRLAGFRRGHDDGLRHAADQVAPAHFHAFLAQVGIGGADTDLDFFSGAFADHQFLLFAHEPDDRVVKHITGDSDRRTDHDAAQAQNSHVGRAAADIDDHRAARLGNVQACSQRRRQRFFD